MFFSRELIPPVWQQARDLLNVQTRQQGSRKQHGRRKMSIFISSRRQPKQNPSEATQLQLGFQLGEARVKHQAFGAHSIELVKREKLKVTKLWRMSWSCDHSLHIATGSWGAACSTGRGFHTLHRKKDPHPSAKL